MQTAEIPTYVPKRSFTRVYGDGPGPVESASDGVITLTVPPLSAAVYDAGRIPSSKAAPEITLAQPLPAQGARGRMHVSADVDGASFYEVTFSAKVRDGRWQPNRHRRHHPSPASPPRSRRPVRSCWFGS